MAASVCTLKRYTNIVLICCLYKSWNECTFFVKVWFGFVGFAGKMMPSLIYNNRST